MLVKFPSQESFPERQQTNQRSLETCQAYLASQSDLTQLDQLWGSWTLNFVEIECQVGLSVPWDFCLDAVKLVRICQAMRRKHDFVVFAGSQAGKTLNKRITRRSLFVLKSLTANQNLFHTLIVPMLHESWRIKRHFNHFHSLERLPRSNHWIRIPGKQREPVFKC